MTAPDSWGAVPVDSRITMGDPTGMDLDAVFAAINAGEAIDAALFEAHAAAVALTHGGGHE